MLYDKKLMYSLLFSLVLLAPQAQSLVIRNFTGLDVAIITDDGTELSLANGGELTDAPADTKAPLPPTTKQGAWAEIVKRTTLSEEQLDILRAGEHARQVSRTAEGKLTKTTSLTLRIGKECFNLKGGDCKLAPGATEIELVAQTEEQVDTEPDGSCCGCIDTLVLLFAKDWLGSKNTVKVTGINVISHKAAPAGTTASGEFKLEASKWPTLEEAGSKSQAHVIVSPLTLATPVKVALIGNS